MISDAMGSNNQREVRGSGKTYLMHCEICRRVGFGPVITEFKPDPRDIAAGALFTITERDPNLSDEQREVLNNAAKICRLSMLQDALKNADEMKRKTGAKP